MSFGGQNMKDFRRARKSPVRDVPVDAFNFQKPGQIEDKPMPPSKPRFRQTASYFAPSALAKQVPRQLWTLSFPTQQPILPPPLEHQSRM
jgi:hypothetical protein